MHNQQILYKSKESVKGGKRRGDLWGISDTAMSLSMHSPHVHCVICRLLPSTEWINKNSEVTSVYLLLIKYTRTLSTFTSLRANAMQHNVNRDCSKGLCKLSVFTSLLIHRMTGHHLKCAGTIWGHNSASCFEGQTKKKKGPVLYRNDSQTSYTNDHKFTLLETGSVWAANLNNLCFP